MKPIDSEVICPRVLCLGDSIMQLSLKDDDDCWGALLAQEHRRDVDVAHRGFGGFTSRKGKSLLSQLLTPGNNLPQTLLIWFGANEHVKENRNLYVSLDEYEANLDEIIDHAVSVGLRLSQIFIITPIKCKFGCLKDFSNNPKDNPSMEKKSQKCRRWKKYAATCIRIAAKKQTRLIDLNSIIAAQPKWKSDVVDQMHLSTRGSNIIAANVAAALYPSVDIHSITFTRLSAMLTIRNKLWTDNAEFSAVFDHRWYYLSTV